MFSADSLLVQKGSIFVYRVFDIAEEVSLQTVERILSQPSGESRVKLAERTRDAVVVRNAPVRISLGEAQLGISQIPIKMAEVTATVWDYGALSISFRIPLDENTRWKDLLSLASSLNMDSEVLTKIDSLARAKAKDVVQLISNALIRHTFWPISEDYIVYFFESLAGIKEGKDLLQRTHIAELLLGESNEALSDETRERILQNVFQYSNHDLTILDWNSAVVFEPTGQREILDVLEFALTQLLEVRYYDEQLDLRLAELYSSVEAGRSRLFQNQFGRISKDANTRFMEFSEFMERMNNSLKVVGDFYLARIFRGAIRRFRISDWEDSITRKMNVLAQVSSLLQGEMNVRRSHFLEIIIIFLILLELVSTVIRNWS